MMFNSSRAAGQWIRGFRLASSEPFFSRPRVWALQILAHGRYCRRVRRAARRYRAGAGTSWWGTGGTECPALRRSISRDRTFSRPEGISVLLCLLEDGQEGAAVLAEPQPCPGVGSYLRMIAETLFATSDGHAVHPVSSCVVPTTVDHPEGIRGEPDGRRNEARRPRNLPIQCQPGTITGHGQEPLSVCVDVPLTVFRTVGRIRPCHWCLGRRIRSDRPADSARPHW